MAIRQQTLELILSGRLDSRYGATFQKAQQGLNKYKRMLTGVASSERAASAARAVSAGSLLRSVAGYAGAYFGAQQLATGIWSTVKAANESATEQNRMTQLMMNVRNTTLAQVQAIQQYNTLLSSRITIDDEVIARGQGQLATFQLQAKAIKQLTPAMLDLAVGTYGMNANAEQLQQTGNLLGKVMTGQIGALSRVGISFTKAQGHILKTGTEAQKTATLIQVINQNYGGLAKKMASTPAGRIAQMAVAWGNVKEEIGGALSPVIMKALGYVAGNLPQIQRTLMQMVSGGKKLITVLTPVAMFVYRIGKWVVDNWSTVGPIIMGIVGALTAWKIATTVLTVAQTALNLAMTMNPIGLIIVAIGALIGLVYLLVKNWDAARAAMVRAWEWFVRFATEGPGRFIPIIGIIGQIAKNWGTVKAALVGVWNWAKRVYEWFVKAFGAAKNLISKVASNPVGRAAMTAAGGPLGALVANRLRKRAMGGPVSAGSPYLVGERGPELFVPKRSGGIVPNHQLAGAGGISLTINSLTINGAANANDVRDGVRMALSDFKRLLAQAQRDDARRSFE